MIPHPYGETVTRVRAAPPDRYGDPTGSPVETDFAGCAVWPTDANASSANEQNDRRDTVIWGYTIQLPAGTDVKATDQWRWQGSLYEQIGEAGRYRNPATGTEVLTVTVRRVTG